MTSKDVYTGDFFTIWSETDDEDTFYYMMVCNVTITILKEVYDELIKEIKDFAKKEETKSKITGYG